MEASRQVLTFLLSIAMTVAPLQGVASGHGQMSDVHVEHAKDVMLRDGHSEHSAAGSDAHCAHNLDEANHSHDAGKVQMPARALRATGMTPLCDCSDNCQCCHKVLTPAIPSLYTTMRVSFQIEPVHILSRYTGTFVLVKTRPPTS